MANTKSAQKAVRQTIRRTVVNKSRRSEMRTYVRKVEEAIASKDPEGRRRRAERGRAASWRAPHRRESSTRMPHRARFRVWPKRVKALSAG